MKIRKIKYIFCVVLLVISFTGCDDLLEVTPKTQLASEGFWKTPADFKLYTNSYYNMYLPNYYKSDSYTLGYFAGDFTSDNAVKGSYDTFLNGESNIPTSGGGSTGFGFSDISKLNYFLAHMSNYTGESSSIAQYAGETYFFLAKIYFDRVKQFGDFQYTTAVLSVSSSELYIPRFPRNEVIDNVLVLLDKAIENLPLKKDLSERRVSKELAYLLKSRVALYEGTWEKYHAGTDFAPKISDPQKYLRLAAKACEDLMALNTCGLDNMTGDWGYNKLFNQTDYTASKEILLWRPYQTGYGHKITSISRGGAYGGATRDLVESYLYKDGTPIELDKYDDSSYGSIAKDRDPRLFQSIVFPKHMLFYATPTPQTYLFPWVDNAQATWQNVTGYQIYKGHDWADATRMNEINYAGIVATIYYRYAEVLLNYAEAKAELGTITQETLDKTINQLRIRAGMSGMLSLGNVPNDIRNDWNISPILYEIRRERRVELAFEGFRFDDLKRWALVSKVLKSWKPLGVNIALFNPNAPLTSLKRKGEGSLLNSIFVDALGKNAIDTIIKVIGQGWLAEGGEDGKIVRKFYLDPSRANKQYMDPYTGAISTSISLQAGYLAPDKIYLNPIPKVEISNNNKIIQNPGW